MFIIRNKKIFILISSALVLLSLASLFVFGINVGIDFKGGALTEVMYTDVAPTIEEINRRVEVLELSAVPVQPTGERGYIVKTRALSAEEHTALLSALSDEEKNQLTEVSYNSIGPSVGRELTRKAVIAVILVSLSIIFFIAFSFRKVSKPVSSWKYGFISIITLFHDVIIPVGLFVVLSNFYGVELDTLFVVAILTILGLSLSDTIVIFDRVRENLKTNEENNIRTPFADVVGVSLEQSYARSLATALTVILVLLALIFFGPASTRYFALMLSVGMFVGSYSSIFLASSLLVLWEEKQAKSQKV